MKKLLVVLMAALMVIGMATGAYAYTDTDSLSTAQQDAIYKLSALGVINGYPDNTFGPAHSITRAEFAKIACIAAGLGDANQALKNTPSGFSDVATGMWYTGYVNIASANGLINGYPDHTFKPAKTISMAEVVTILMRIAGYNDNLPGSWPLDYIGQAAIQGVTEDVTFLANTAATRADVAVMTGNLLNVVLVVWTPATGLFVADAEDTTVLVDSFGALIYDDVIFSNSCDSDDAVDGWHYSDFDKKEVTLTFSRYDTEADSGAGDFVAYQLLMQAGCYISGSNSLTTIGGQEANVIVNKDNEVIYINVLSSVAYSDDVSGTVEHDDLQVNGKDVDTAFEYTDWDTGCFDSSDSGYAKVFYNQSGDVYAVSDLEDEAQFGSDVLLADSYDASKSILYALSDTDLSLKNQNCAVYKDGLLIAASDIEQLDVISVLHPLSGEADLVLIVDPLVSGTLSSGDDDTVTVANKKYNYSNTGLTHYNLEGGLTGGFSAVLNDVNDLEGVFDSGVKLALCRNPYEVAYLIAGNSGSARVYGVITDLKTSGMSGDVSEVTVLNQNGRKVAYKMGDDKDVLTYEAGIPATDVVIGSYVELRLDEEGAIDALDAMILAASADDVLNDDMTVSSSKIRIAGTWYKINSDTLFFETATDGTGYLSTNFDEANLISVSAILNADTVYAVKAEIAADSEGVLQRLFLVDSDISKSGEGYSFVDRLYTVASGRFVEMLDGTSAKRADGEFYTANVFYSYDIRSSGMYTDEIFVCGDLATANKAASPFEDAYWVLTDGSLAATGGEPYALSEFVVAVADYSGDVLTLGGHYYTVTGDTVCYLIDAGNVAHTASSDDIDEGGDILTISDSSGNLLYVFILE